MTENNYYRVYVESIYELAASLMLKCGQTALMMNQQVDIEGGKKHYDELDETTWKYYRNICGEYFPTDERMIITSLDDMSEIEFSKQNLVKHQATGSGYRFGSKYYLELLDQYPQNELLIRGILYPADMDMAITSRDGTVLAYPAGLIEPTEYSFLLRLQEWIYGFMDRWDGSWFNNTDNLYKAGLWAVLFASLPGVITTLRLRACKTKEAHSYHVRQYLSSHSRLDRYSPYMTRDQQMFFYRNIAYIEHNSGMADIFDWLIDNCFNPRGLPIAEFRFAHNLEEMSTTLKPIAFFNKNPINTPGNIDGINEYSLPMILDLEQKIEPPNEKYRPEDEPTIIRKITNSLSDAAPTKVLESSAMDYTDSEKYRLSEIMLEHWIWFAAKDLYKSFIRVTIPSQGTEISLSAKDAVVLYSYCMQRNFGFNPTKITGHRVNRVQRLGEVPFASPRQVATTERVSDEWIQEMMALMPEPVAFVSVQSFRNYCTRLFIAANLQYKMSCLHEIKEERAQTHLAMSRMYETNFVYLGDEEDQTYGDWFTRRNISLRDISKEDWQEMEALILSEILGDSLVDSVALKDIQRAMIQTTTTLSSYSIHIGADINLGPVIQYGCPDIRYTYNGTWIKTVLRLRDATERIVSLKFKLKHLMKWNTRNLIQYTFRGAAWWDKICYLLPKQPGKPLKIRSTVRYRYPAKLNTKLVENSTVTTQEGKFANLDPDVRAALLDAWDYTPAV